MKKPRKHYTPQEKVAILRRHLIEKVAVSDLCEELQLQPTVFYRWLKEFFETGAAAFECQPRAGKQLDGQQRRIAALEEKLKTKNEVLAELMEEHVALKKVLGRSEGPMGPPRHPRPGGGLRAPLGPAHRDRRQPAHGWARGGCQQVLPLAGALGPVCGPFHEPHLDRCARGELVSPQESFRSQERLLLFFMAGLLPAP